MKQLQTLISNRNYLLGRQQANIELLKGRSENIDNAHLEKSIEDLLRSQQKQSIFNTFAGRCTKPQIFSLNALADMNVGRALNPIGLPFSVKDHLKVEGMIQSCGFSDNLTQSTTTSEVVRLLQQNGCVAYAHSNVPQGILGIQSNNNVYGMSKNPWKEGFISGGSSGGEAALVSVRASAFGVCSDSGGSARIPASFCGVYGFKPTGSKRMSVRGRVGPTGKQGVTLTDVDPSFGFMTHSVNDLAWLCSKTLGKSVDNESPYLYGGEWNAKRFQEAKGKKMRFGYIIEDDEMRTAPAIKNCILQVVNKLREQGHQVVPFQFPELHKFRNFFFDFVHATSFLDAIMLRQQLNGDTPTEHNKTMLSFAKSGPSAINSLIKQLTDQHEKELYSRYTGDKSLMQMMGLIRDKNNLKTSFLKKWRQMNLDGLISPVMPFTAPLQNTSHLLIHQLTFCSFQNILQLPCGSIPMRKVLKSQTNYPAATFYEKQIAESIAKSEGLPISIQVTGAHLKDQQCVALMWIIQKLRGKPLEIPFL